jgi:hypothetical protein
MTGLGLGVFTAANELGLDRQCNTGKEMSALRVHVCIRTGQRPSDGTSNQLWLGIVTEPGGKRGVAQRAAGTAAEHPFLQRFLPATREAHARRRTGGHFQQFHGGSATYSRMQQTMRG